MYRLQGLITGWSTGDAAGAALNNAGAVQSPAEDAARYDRAATGST